MTTVTKRASYRKAVEWVALNDEPEITSADDMSYMISISLIASIFGKTSDEVAKAVIRYRDGL